MWVALVLACNGNPASDGADGGPTDGTPPADSGDTGEGTTPIDTPTDTGTPPSTDPCEASPGLEVLDVTTDTPWRSHELEVTVTLSEPASVAVACTLSADPDEVHLVEGLDDTATTHVLRIPGLLADNTYDCVANAVCPRAGGPAATFQHATGPDPAFLPAIQTTEFDPAAGDEYLLANAAPDCWWADGQVLVADRSGRIRWWTDTPPWVGPSIEFRYHGDDLFVWGGGWEANSSGRPRQVDLYEGELYDSAVAMADVNQSEYHHDGKMLPDGRLLTLEEVTIQASPTDFTGFQVRRIDPLTDTVDFAYHAQRAYDEGHLPWGLFDAWHANWVDIVDIDGDEVLLVSFCFLGQVGAIDVATGEWRWTFGPGGDWDLQDTTGSPLPDDQYSQCQHGLEMEPPNLLVYDNGTGRQFSRATEYTLDEATMTATLEWTWTEPDWYESTLGDVDYMPSGNVWIGMGHAECFSTNRGDRSTVVELDPVSGTKLWEAQYSDVGTMLYRADFADACELFANAKYCPDVADRVGELSAELAP